MANPNPSPGHGSSRSPQLRRFRAPIAPATSAAGVITPGPLPGPPLLIEGCDIEAIARRLHDDFGAGSHPVDDWAEARKIDLIAVSTVGLIVSSQYLPQVAEGELDAMDACVVAPISGFQLGIETERHRREGGGRTC
jgi:hypothetical protein